MQRDSVALDWAVSLMSFTATTYCPKFFPTASKTYHQFLRVKMATSSASSDVESLLDQLKILEKHPLEDENLRERLYEATRKLNWALETPSMTIQRMMYTVRISPARECLVD